MIKNVFSFKKTGENVCFTVSHINFHFYRDTRTSNQLGAICWNINHFIGKKSSFIDQKLGEF